MSTLAEVKGLIERLDALQSDLDEAKAVARRLLSLAYQVEDPTGE